jgi:hypothetical protein
VTRSIKLVLSILALLVGAGWLAARGLPTWRARHLTPLVQAFMSAADRGDSVALAGLSVSSEPTNWGLAVHRRAPRFAVEASRGLRVQSLAQNGDTSVVAFSLDHPLADPECPFRPLRLVQASFVRQAGAWRITRISTEPC